MSRNLRLPSRQGPADQNSAAAPPRYPRGTRGARVAKQLVGVGLDPRGTGDPAGVGEGHVLEPVESPPGGHGRLLRHVLGFGGGAEDLVTAHTRTWSAPVSKTPRTPETGRSLA